MAQELRDAVRRFRAGRQVRVAYADTFGELGSGNEGYYLATRLRRRSICSPWAWSGLTGLAAEVPLARDLLDRASASRIEVLRRAEYKTALESLTDERALRAQPRAARGPARQR